MIGFQVTEDATPREIVTALRSQIAAQSPRHAALVAACTTMPLELRDIAAWKQDHAQTIKEAAR